MSMNYAEWRNSVTIQDETIFPSLGLPKEAIKTENSELLVKLTVEQVKIIYSDNTKFLEEDKTKISNCLISLIWSSKVAEAIKTKLIKGAVEQSTWTISIPGQIMNLVQSIKDSRLIDPNIDPIKKGIFRDKLTVCALCSLPKESFKASSDFSILEFVQGYLSPERIDQRTLVLRGQGVNIELNIKIAVGAESIKEENLKDLAKETVLAAVQESKDKNIPLKMPERNPGRIIPLLSEIESLHNAEFSYPVSSKELAELVKRIHVPATKPINVSPNKIENNNSTPSNNQTGDDYSRNRNYNNGYNSNRNFNNNNINLNNQNDRFDNGQYIRPINISYSSERITKDENTDDKRPAYMPIKNTFRDEISIHIRNQGKEYIATRMSSEINADAVVNLTHAVSEFKDSYTPQGFLSNIVLFRAPNKLPYCAVPKYVGIRLEEFKEGMNLGDRQNLVEGLLNILSKFHEKGYVYGMMNPNGIGFISHPNIPKIPNSSIAPDLVNLEFLKPSNIIPIAFERVIKQGESFKPLYSILNENMYVKEPVDGPAQFCHDLQSLVATVYELLVGTGSLDNGRLPSDWIVPIEKIDKPLSDLLEYMWNDPQASAQKALEHQYFHINGGQNTPYFNTHTVHHRVYDLVNMILTAFRKVLISPQFIPQNLLQMFDLNGDNKLQVKELMIGLLNMGLKMYLTEKTKLELQNASAFFTTQHSGLIGFEITISNIEIIVSNHITKLGEDIDLETCLSSSASDNKLPGDLKQTNLNFVPTAFSNENMINDLTNGLKAKKTSVEEFVRLANSRAHYNDRTSFKNTILMNIIPLAGELFFMNLEYHLKNQSKNGESENRVDDERKDDYVYKLSQHIIRAAEDPNLFCGYKC